MHVVTHCIRKTWIENKNKNKVRLLEWTPVPTNIYKRNNIQLALECVEKVNASAL